MIILISSDQLVEIAIHVAVLDLAAGQSRYPHSLKPRHVLDLILHLIFDACQIQKLETLLETLVKEGVSASPSQ